MSRQTLLWLGLLLVALGGLAWWQLQREREGAFVSEVPLFEDVAPEDVVAMRIDNLERGVQTRFERRPDGWWLTDPIEVRADEAVVQKLLEVVDRNRAIVVPPERADAKLLGLEPPRAVFDVFERTGDEGELERHRVEVGLRDLDPLYVHVRARGLLLRTLTNLDTQIDKEVHDYRTKRIVHLAPHAIVEVNRTGRLQRGLTQAPLDLSLSAVREGAAWRLLRPYEAALDPIATSVLVVGATSLSADRFVEDAAPELSEHGLAEPSFTIELADVNDERVTLLFGRPSEDVDWRVMRAGDPTIYRIAPEDFPPLVLPREDMLDGLLVRVARDELDLVRLQSPERTLVLRRLPDGWTVATQPREALEPGPARPADPQRVQDLLSRLEGAELLDFRPGEPFPESAPPRGVFVEARGVVFGGRIGPEATTDEGEPARLYQRVNDEVLALAPPFLVELTETRPEDLLDPQLLAVEELLLSGLRFEHGDLVLRYTRDERGRWHPAGEDREATELLPLLDPLLFLRAAEHLDPEQSPPLDEPIRVVFERSEGDELEALLGLGLDQQSRPRAEAAVGPARAVLAIEDLHARVAALFAE